MDPKEELIAVLKKNAELLEQRCGDLEKENARLRTRIKRSVDEAEHAKPEPNKKPKNGEPPRKPHCKVCSQPIKGNDHTACKQQKQKSSDQ